MWPLASAGPIIPAPSRQIHEVIAAATSGGDESGGDEETIIGYGPLAGRLAATGGEWEPYGCLIAVAWLLRRPEDAITVQELAGLYRTARRTPAGS